MLHTILMMYITMMPVILAGIFNMLFVKTNFYKNHRTPIDGRKKLSDGKRVFGENKTWIGFTGMIVSGMLAQVLWGFICSMGLEELNYFYQYHNNNLTFNMLAGGLAGLAYVLFELPNSFVKRRIEIPEGKTVTGGKGAIFFVIDQVDSLFGVGLLFTVLYPMPVWQYFLYILLGAGTHVLVNFILLQCKIRKNL